jgi:hypothetical protein
MATQFGLETQTGAVPRPSCPAPEYDAGLDTGVAPRCAGPVGR